MISIFLTVFTLLVINYNSYLNSRGYYKLLKSPFDNYLIKLATWMLIVSFVLTSSYMVFVIHSFGFTKLPTHNLVDMIIIFSAVLQLLMTWGYSAGVRANVRIITQCYPDTNYRRNVLRTVAETLADSSTQSAKSVMWFNIIMCNIVGLLSSY